MLFVGISQYIIYYKKIRMETESIFMINYKKFTHNIIILYTKVNELYIINLCYYYILLLVVILLLYYLHAKLKILLNVTTLNTYLYNIY